MNTEGATQRFTIDEVYNGWIVKVSEMDRGNDKLICRYVFPSAEDLLLFLKEKLTNA